MKRILITGTDSFIGESVVRYFLSHAPAYHTDTLDMTDESWKSFDFAGYDTVFHVAGIVHQKERKSMAPVFFSVNRDLAYAVAVKARDQGVRQFIFLSTMSVYGQKTGVIDTKTVPVPNSFYGISKLQAEELLLSLSGPGFFVAILRPPIVYGKGCRGNYPKLARFAQHAPFFPDFHNRRSMLHVDHLAELIRLLIRDGSEGVFFPQNPQEVCVSDLVARIAKAHDRSIPMTRFFNPLIRLLRKRCLHKLFGDLYYDAQMSSYREEYRRFDFDESILRTEGESFQNPQESGPMISVIMPAYRCEQFIGASIESVLRQTYENFELIVIDDGSTDKTADTVRLYCGKDTRIRFEQNSRNMGVSATRNKGIAMARGEWIAFLDSDDCWEPDKLARQLRLAAEKRSGFIFTGSSYIDENGRKYPGAFIPPSQVTYRSLLLHNVISCSSVLIRREYFTDVQMARDDMHEDYAVWLRILKKGIRAVAVREPLLIYRISSGSKSGNKLKTFKMTYRVYRFIGICRGKAFYFTLRHIGGSIRKYAVIKGIMRCGH